MHTLQSASPVTFWMMTTVERVHFDPSGTQRRHGRRSEQTQETRRRPALTVGEYRGPSGHSSASDTSSNPPGKSRVRTVLSGTLMSHVRNLSKSPKTSGSISPGAGVQELCPNSSESFSTPLSVFSVGLQSPAEQTSHSGSPGSRLTTSVVLGSTVTTIIRPSEGEKRCVDTEQLDSVGSRV
ncbi:hypothetical protein EYF80_027960 [Liparis tanakae]|uniref:Uncharacterized protein n=1 Tax=Liparis tanakae TaxID=230148 RepID=A0A4Z2H9Z1_9TELE|nr:hypothetical protein EYF80_027960 [Liparis tanakae]